MIRPHHRVSGPRTLRMAAAFMLLCISGCQPETGQVAGRVIYRQEALKTGTVSFFCPDGQIFSSLLDAEGNYSVAGLPMGPTRVTVVSHPPAPLGFLIPQRLPYSKDAPKLARSESRANEATGPRPPVLPGKFGLPEQSGLGLLVGKGSQHFDIDLDR